MRRLLVVLLLVVIAVGVVGVYRDWFQFSTEHGRDAGKVSVDLTIDKDKIRADAETATDRAKAAGDQAVGAVTPKATAGESPAK